MSYSIPLAGQQASGVGRRASSFGREASSFGREASGSAGLRIADFGIVEFWIADCETGQRAIATIRNQQAGIRNSKSEIQNLKSEI